MSREEFIKVRGTVRKTLRELDQKIEEVRTLFDGILLRVPAEAVREEFAQFVIALDSQKNQTIPAELHTFTSKVWAVIIDLHRYEKKFLVSLFAVQMMRERFSSLHPEVRCRYDIMSYIDRFDSLRANSKKSIPEKRKAFIELDELMRVAERDSKLLAKEKNRIKKEIRFRKKIRKNLSPDLLAFVQSLCHQARKKARRLMWVTGSRDRWHEAITPQD